jgi:hypothetical protein
MNCIAIDNLNSKNVKDIWYQGCTRYRYKIYDYKRQYGTIISIYCWDRWVDVETSKGIRESYTKLFDNIINNHNNQIFRSTRNEFFSIVAEPADHIATSNLQQEMRDLSGYAISPSNPACEIFIRE